MTRSPRRLLTLAVAVVSLTGLTGLAACSDAGEEASETSRFSSESEGAEPEAGESEGAEPEGGESEGGESEGAEPEGGESGPSCEYEQAGEAAAEVDLPPETAAVTEETPATLETSVGEVAVTLAGSEAPCTVNSFVSLAEQGYFDDTPCHRLTTGAGLAVLQCGDPTGTGTGGPGYSFADELSGDESYPAGTLAMANTGRPDTNGSQFFMVYADSELPPAYTVFGSIEDASLEVLEEVAADGVEGGGGDGPPATAVDISAVEVG